MCGLQLGWGGVPGDQQGRASSYGCPQRPHFSVSWKSLQAPLRESCPRVPTGARQFSFSRMSLGPQRLSRNWSSELETPSRLKKTTVSSAAIPLRMRLRTFVLPHRTSSESRYAFLFPSSCRISTQPAFLWFWMMSVAFF
uniref:Uncharacterized protein n=1 Tax=Myotis myotis TaxID=51298 RepID=A0A7J7S255_MYOMY|nr:hypothetical protein mMyoMyo1_010107 [Myotis myotis]